MRAPLLLMSVLSVLSGCVDKGDEETGGSGADGGDGGAEGTDGQDGGDGGDGGDGEDGGDGGDPGPAAVSVVAVSPASLVGADGGVLTVSLAPGDGVCASGCAVVFHADGEEVVLEGALEESPDGAYLLQVTVPAARVDHGVVMGRVVSEGVDVGQVPLRFRLDNGVAMDSLDPIASSSVSFAAGIFEGLAPIVSATRMLESAAGGLSLGVLSGPYSPDVVDDFDGLSEDLVWSRVSENGGVADTVQLGWPRTAPAADDVHFGSITVRRDGQDDTQLVVLSSPGSLDVHELAPDDTGKFVARTITPGLSGDDLPDLILDIAPIEDRDGQLNIAMLGLNQGPDGTWKGVWFDGNKAYGWEEVGSVRAQDVATGAAMLGLVHTGQARAADSGSTAHFWTFDPRQVKDGCAGLVGISQLGSSVTPVRTIAIEDAAGASCETFDAVHAAAAVALDGDEDGQLDLVVRTWGTNKDGEATHSDHFIPQVLNKEARTSSVRLQPKLAAAGYRPAELGDWSLEPKAKVSSSRADAAAHMGAGGGGGGWLSLDGIRFPAMASGEGEPSAWQEVRNVWSPASLASAAALSESGPTSEDAGGGGVFASNSDHAPPPNNCSGHGVCHMGACYVKTVSAAQALSGAAGGGTTGGTSSSSLSSGETIWVTNQGAGLSAHRVSDEAMVGGDMVVDVVGSDDALAELWVDGATGAHLLSAAGEVMPIGAANRARVLWKTNEDGLRKGVVALWDFDDGHALDSSFGKIRPRRIGVVAVGGGAPVGPGLTLPEAASEGGTTSPFALGPVAEDGAVALLWWDGQGQAWVGRADVVSAAAMGEGSLPFLAGPMAVGGANPDFLSSVGISDSQPLAVMARVGAPDQPLLDESPESVAQRYRDWSPTASHGALAGEQVLMMVADFAGATTGVLPPEGCSEALLLLPVRAIGSDDWGSTAGAVFAETAGCGDILRPVAAGPFLADGRDMVVLYKKDPEVPLSAVLEGAEMSTLAVDNPIFQAPADASNNVLHRTSGSGDANGDGLPDLLVVASIHDGALLMSSNGDGSFSSLATDHEVDALGTLLGPDAVVFGDTLSPAPAAVVASPLVDLRR